MGFNTATFQLLLDAGFAFLWDSTPIPQTDTNTNGEPRLGAHLLNTAGSLGLYLHYLRSPTREVGLQLIFALIPSMVNRYLAFTHQMLLNTLRQYPAAGVGWPGNHSQFSEMANLVQVAFGHWLCDPLDTRSCTSPTGSTPIACQCGWNVRWS